MGSVDATAWTVVGAAIGSNGVILALLGVMMRDMNRGFEETNRRIDDMRTELISCLTSPESVIHFSEIRSDEASPRLGPRKHRADRAVAGSAERRVTDGRRGSTVHHTTLMIIGGLLLVVGILIVAIGNVLGR